MKANDTADTNDVGSPVMQSTKRSEVSPKKARKATPSVKSNASKKGKSPTPRKRSRSVDANGGTSSVASTPSSKKKPEPNQQEQKPSARKSPAPSKRKNSIDNVSSSSSSSGTNSKTNKGKGKSAQKQPSSPLRTPTRKIAEESPRKKLKDNNGATKAVASSSSSSSASKTKTKDAVGSATTKRTTRGTPTPPTKPRPTMDVAVHRMRHLGYKPQPILAMASTPFHPDACDYVAVSRDNGSVELKSPDEKWRTVATIAGMPSRTVDTMTWVCDGTGGNDNNDSTGGDNLSKATTFCSSFQKQHTAIHAKRTLIGASKDGTIFVIDFARGRHTAVTGSGGGAVFCLVSLSDVAHDPYHSGSSSQLVAAGCEDGFVRMYRYTRGSDGSDSLELVSRLACASTAILSLAWKRVSQHHSLGGTILYVGVADGTIRRFDGKTPSINMGNNKATGSDTGTATSGTVNRSLVWKSKYRITVENYGRNTPTKVWALSVLGDGTIVSGDSLGHVQFWDGVSGTLSQTFDQNDHKADVLALAVSHDERQVFASGVDSRVVCIQRANPGGVGGNGYKWIMTNAQRPHTHDVRALATFRVHSRHGSMTKSEDPNECLCSGGIDTKLCSYTLRRFRNERPRSWYPWPSISPLSMAKQARVLLMIRDQSLELHKIGPATKPTQTPVLLPEDDTLIGTMDVKGDHNLTCGAISPDGKLFAVSNANKTLLFSIRYVENEDGSTGFLPTQISLTGNLAAPSSTMSFVSNSSLVKCTADGTVELVNALPNDNGTIKAESGGTVSAPSETAFPCHSLNVSSDGKWIAVVRSGSGSDVVTVLRVATDESSNDNRATLESYWQVPGLESSVTATSFIDPETSDSKAGHRLVVACANYAFYLFDVLTKTLSHWSEKQGFPMSASLPHEIKSHVHVPVRVFGDPSDPKKFLVVSFIDLFVFGVHNHMCIRTHRRRRTTSWQDRYSGMSWRSSLRSDLSACQSCNMKAFGPLAAFALSR